MKNRLVSMGEAGGPLGFLDTFLAFLCLQTVLLPWMAVGQLATDPWLIPFTASGRILSSPAASPSELTIYFGDNSGVLYAVDP